MVTVTMEQIMAFNDMDNIFENVNLPLKVAYKMNKLKKAIKTESEFYLDKFRGIIDTYAKRDEDGKYILSEDETQIMIQEDKLDVCNEELVNLQELTVEIDNLGLSIDDFGDNIECTPEDLEPLMPFLN